MEMVVGAKHSPDGVIFHRGLSRRLGLFRRGRNIVADVIPRTYIPQTMFSLDDKLNLPPQNICPRNIPTTMLSLEVGVNVTFLYVGVASGLNIVRAE